ncbi:MULTISPECIES: pyridoxal 5'-phosphate synthase glutaminase subunit PdxT [Desulfosporosinus]|uniref:pyridoxal 5'-phosphate synthase glutaminase subunit PdxT n=1 Tax=Desulfosporosinus TaxID=79206 RepID=UPI00207CD3A2|nr:MULTISPECIES: pyridoxal 5'-phosphate synthase glutaminase subunit PdxT [Desulfosporosinus]MCO1601408.1 pyridoxal 5'-phosphate synthase glutaminase subunit PdxT [Desulfosporosinus nitroreducens]MCO5386246.1 pyridoxal 5'-phosphate synthase glutaminase subunit PdxT [Desulfosporosinus sp.]MDA8223302.1 pyridoxal 5'-phosphate synthase glutaminase subunit PdxT [Desulfitobacterium hafniense]
MKKRVGVLALQGAFREHRQVLEKLGCDVTEVRRTSDLDGIQGLIIPGGESTTIGKLLIIDEMGERIKELGAKDMPIFGTCAGMILLSKTIVDSDQYRLNLMDTVVERNAFGRQVASFETDLQVPALGVNPLRAVFIRAPYLKEVAPNVGILAEYNGKIVFVRQGNLLASAFHPELTPDNRVHQYFLNMIDEH